MINDKLKIEKIMVDGQPQLKLKGVIDEDASFDVIKKENGPLYLNLSEVTGINSLGIRNWVNLWKELSGREIFYIECPPVIVRQMNMIPSFSGQAKVVSVFVPYVCDNCETEKLVLVGQQELSLSSPKVAESFSCENCKNGEMELDGNPKQYFAFKK